MSSYPQISVIVAAFNAAETVVRCVQSALAQSEVAEVVLADDASRDDTLERARQGAGGDPRLVGVRLESNAGPSRARNAAIDASRSDLICILDADDWLQPGRFTRLLQEPGDWDLLADDLLTADEGEPGKVTGALLGLEDSRLVDGRAFVRSNISHPKRPRRELGYLKPLMRRDFLVRHGLRYDEQLRLGEDYVLYTEALLAGARLRVAPACGYVAVRRRDSLSHRHGAAELAALAEADARLIGTARAVARPMVAPLIAHRGRTLRERDFRRALDAKASGRWWRVATEGLRTPATTAYIAKELWRASRRRRGASQQAAYQG